VDDSERYADFHSLRHTTGSPLAASGVHPKIAQILMRHCDINLTMNRYTHSYIGQISEAVKKLPDLSLPSSEKQLQPESTIGPSGSTLALTKNLQEMLSLITISRPCMAKQIRQRETRDNTWQIVISPFQRRH
jgi:hypothetical protein